MKVIRILEYEGDEGPLTEHLHHRNVAARFPVSFVTSSTKIYVREAFISTFLEGGDASDQPAVKPTQ